MDLSQIISGIKEKCEGLDASTFNKYAKIYKFTDMAVLADFCSGRGASVLVIEKLEHLSINGVEFPGVEEAAEKVTKTVKEHFAWEGSMTFAEEVSVEKISDKKYKLVVSF